MSERRTRPRQSGALPPSAIGRKQQALQLAREGLPPTAIADRMGVPFAAAMSHLYGLVGEGALKRSDIVFSFDQDTRDAELALHDRFRAAFVAAFGEDQWWREGVPATVRAECAALYEHDPDPAPDAFAYTTLIHLREILDKRWDVLAPALPRAMQSDRKKLMADLVTLNRIRNAVMHPVRRATFTDREFLFVRAFARTLA